MENPTKYSMISIPAKAAALAFMRSPLSASLVIHLALFLFLALFVQIRNSLPVSMIKPQTRTVMIDLSPAPHKNQIVRTDEGREVKQALPNAYLGEKSRVVDEEKISRTERAESRQRSQSSNEAQPSRTERQSHSLSKFGVAMIPQYQKPRDQPQWVDYSEQFGKAGSAEYVQGVKESETTALNTKEFVFYGYYERIRKQLDQAWRPILYDHLLDRMRTGRQLASSKDYITRTLVTLDKNGDVVKVQVLEASGTRELDKAAVDAFNRAGPFPNPPQGLISGAGQVEVRWDFVIRS